MIPQVFLPPCCGGIISITAFMIFQLQLHTFRHQKAEAAEVALAVLAVEASLEAVSPVAALAAEAAEAGKSIIKTSPCVLRTCFLFPFPCYAKPLS